MRTITAIALPPALEELEAIPAPVIADTIERLLEALDRRDGDPDEEELGLEDSFEDHFGKFGTEGPGCAVADEDFGIDDERHDDDDPAEDDDPGGGNVTDEPHDGEAEDGI